MSRWIACLVIESFAAGLMRLRQPTLARQPLVLVEYGVKRAKVVAASADALALGVCPNLTLNRARGLCPQAQFVGVDTQQDEQALNRLLDILWTFSNRVEVDMTAYPQSAVCYIDLGSLNEADVRHLVEAMLYAVKDGMRLLARVGVAGGKLAARLAADEANTPTLIARDGERAFIARFPVESLPLTKEAKHRLVLLGLRQIGQFADLPSSAVLAQFGKRGRGAHQLAQGLDGRPVIPKQMPPTEAAVRDFDDPLSSALRLERIFHGMAVELEKRLDGRTAAVHRLVLILKFADETCPRETLHLLEPVSTAANLERVIKRLLERFTLTHALVGVEVQLAHLVTSKPRQLELFTAKPVRQQLIDLTQVLAERFQHVDFLEGELAERGSLALERRVHFRSVKLS